MVGTHRRLPGSTRRKVGMTSNHHAPYVLGFTHATMAGTKGCDTARWSESQKAGLSSDWGLQLDPMKSESLVIADQQRCWVLRARASCLASAQMRPTTRRSHRHVGPSSPDEPPRDARQAPAGRGARPYLENCTVDASIF